MKCILFSARKQIYQEVFELWQTAILFLDDCDKAEIKTTKLGNVIQVKECTYLYKKVRRMF